MKIRENPVQSDSSAPDFCDNINDDCCRRTEHNIRPIELVYYVAKIILAGWYELRQYFRHFRADRICACIVMNSFITGVGACESNGT